MKKNIFPILFLFSLSYSQNFVPAADQVLNDADSVRLAGTAALNPAAETINVYFNFSVDTMVAIPGNFAHGNVDFKAKLIERISQAVCSIDLAVYSLSDMPEVADALILAKNRGVKIRVVYDHRGGAPLQNSMKALADTGILISRRPYEAEGIMHNKFFIFDGRDTVKTNDWVWTGSWNVTSTELTWKNNVIEINDPDVAAAYTAEFEEMWGSNTDVPDQLNAKFGYSKLDNTQHDFVVGGRGVHVCFSPSDGTTDRIINYLTSAQNNIYLSLFLFTRDDPRNAIIAQVNSGMNDLRGIIQDIDTPGSEFWTLQNYGEIFQNQSSILHHKYSIIDPSDPASNPAVITGSHNWSTAAEEFNDENTIIINDVYIANQFMQEFKKRYNEAGGTGTFIIPAVDAENEENNTAVFSYKLLQNYPNPFNPVTTIRFEVPHAQYVELGLFDLLGRRVRTLLRGEVPAGITAVDLSADGLAGGIYIYNLIAEEYSASGKMILLK